MNSLNLCEGTITRKRLTDNLNEQAAMDLFLVNQRLLPVVSKMHVDEQGEHQLSNFHGINHNEKVTESDHAKVELFLNLQFEQVKPIRTEAYNFKSHECQQYFKLLTTDTQMFSTCFKSTNTFPNQLKLWQKRLKSCISQSFYKIRSKKRKFCESDVGKLLEKRKVIKLELKVNPYDQKVNEKAQIEAQIAEASEQHFIKKVRETLGHLTGDDGGINTNGIWKAKNKLIPKDKTNIPTALKDNKGNLITNPEGIKKLCLSEMVERLRHRQMHPELLEVQKLKEILCKQR